MIQKVKKMRKIVTFADKIKKRIDIGIFLLYNLIQQKIRKGEIKNEFKN